jgi:HK97 family phage prohead protease
MFKTQNYLKKDASDKKVNSFQMNFKEVKAVDGKLKIKGFASTPDIDRYDDIIQPEAFSNAMKTYMKNPIVLLGHDSNKPIGTVTEYNIDSKGLEVTCEIVNDTEDCMAKIQNKTLRGFSIGWICNDCIFREEGTKYIREVSSLDLVEISVVATPANPSTLFTLAKSLKKMFDDMKVEKKDIGITPEPQAPVETPEVVPPESETPTEESKEVDVEVPPETVDTVETPAPAEVIPEDITPDTSEVVKADEDPIVTPDEVTDDEVKALMESIVTESLEKATAPLHAQILELKTALDCLQEKHTALESDILKIEVPS